MNVFRNDVKVGIFILAAIILFLFGLFQVGGIMERFKPGRSLVLEFSNAQRVQPGTEIIYRGKKIGTVKDVAFDEKGFGVLVECSVMPEAVLFSGTQARTEDKSALGGKLIELYPPQDSQAVTLLGDNEIIPGLAGAGLTDLIINLNKTVVTLDSRLSELMDKADLLLTNLNETSSLASQRLKGLDGFGKQVKDTLQSYVHLAQTLEERANSLSGKLDQSIEKVVPATTATLDEVRLLARQLQGDVATLKTDLQQVLAQTNETLAGANDLMVSNQRDLRESLIALESTLRYLEIFSKQIAERPSSLVWKEKPSRFRPKPKNSCSRRNCAARV